MEIIKYQELKGYITDNGGASFMSKKIYHHNKRTNKFHKGFAFYLYKHLSKEDIKALKERYCNIVTGTAYYKSRPEEIFQTITIFYDPIDVVVMAASAKHHTSTRMS